MASENQPRVQVQVVKKPSMWKDPVVRALGGIIALIILGGLLTVVFALLNGTVDLSGTPTTPTENAIVKYRDLVKKDPTAEYWQYYLEALADAGQTERARDELERAKKSNVDTARGDQLTYAEAQIYVAEGEEKKAAELWESVAKTSFEQYESERKRGGTQNWAVSFGIPKTYSLALANLASYYWETGDTKAALKSMNSYLKANPTNAGMFADRGKLKFEMGDTEGAKADFEKALKFIPDFKDALDGLAKIKEGK